RSLSVTALQRRAPARCDRARDRKAPVGAAVRRAYRRARQRDRHTRARTAAERQRDHERDDGIDYAQCVRCRHGASRHHVLGWSGARDEAECASQAARGAFLVSTMRLPRLISALDRKLLRDLYAMRGQALAIAFVIASGVSVHLVAAGMLQSLEETRRAYYE